MPRLTYKYQGYHNATDEEAATMLKEGWTIITDEEFQKVLAEKGKNEAPTPTPAPVAAPAKTSSRHGNRSNANR